MIVEHVEIGVCGLSCVLCPSYHRETVSCCPGCKSEFRMAAGCPFITCALKRKGVEFCYLCAESVTCEKWRKHREIGKKSDSFKCYQKLEDDIAFLQQHGPVEFERAQRSREQLLREMLEEFNEGRSKSYYCIAATVLEMDELREAIVRAREGSDKLSVKEKSRLLLQFWMRSRRGRVVA